MNGALRRAKSKRCNYAKVGKCRLSAVERLPRRYPAHEERYRWKIRFLFTHPPAMLRLQKTGDSTNACKQITLL